MKTNTIILIGLLLLSVSVTAISVAPTKETETKNQSFTMNKVPYNLESNETNKAYIEQQPKTQETMTISGTGSGETWGLTMKYPSCSKIKKTGSSTIITVSKSNPSCWKDLQELNPTLLEKIQKASKFELIEWNRKL